MPIKFHGQRVALQRPLPLYKPEIAWLQIPLQCTPDVQSATKSTSHIAIHQPIKQSTQIFRLRKEVTGRATDQSTLTSTSESHLLQMLGVRSLA